MMTANARRYKERERARIIEAYKGVDMDSLLRNLGDECRRIDHLVSHEPRDADKFRFHRYVG